MASRTMSGQPQTQPQGGGPRQRQGPRGGSSSSSPTSTSDDERSPSSDTSLLFAGAGGGGGQFTLSGGPFTLHVLFAGAGEGMARRGREGAGRRSRLFSKAGWGKDHTAGRAVHTYCAHGSHFHGCRHGELACVRRRCVGEAAATPRGADPFDSGSGRGLGVAAGRRRWWWGGRGRGCCRYQRASPDLIRWGGGRAQQGGRPLRLLRRRSATPAPSPATDTEPATTASAI